jgi:putative flavoprotein involved in K+ transport
MVEQHDIVVIGDGQAGVALSRHLLDRTADHVVLECGTVGQRQHTERWDSLTFQFPNAAHLADWAPANPSA